MTKINIRFTTILLLLVCYAFSQRAQAVSPAPDGAYPNGNTAEGDSALFSLTSGPDNTAVGAGALFSSTTGSNNTATGFQSLNSNTTANDNTANGFRALISNTTGGGNTATGSQALYSNRTGSANTAIGSAALISNASGANNTATGVGALDSNTTANNNTATGCLALYLNETGGNNTAMGYQALFGGSLTFSKGSYNTAIGSQALYDNQAGDDNTAIGYAALLSNSEGGNNTATGVNALIHSTGSNNIALGASAGSNLTTGGNNIDIGAPGAAGEANKIRIGKPGTQNGTFIAGISGVAVTGSQVVVNSNGKLGVAASSARFKDGIKSMDKASEAILSLKPVTFRYKKELDPEGIPQFGLVAEQVEKVNPDLIARDEQGKPYSVRYEAVNAMLLNEFLKEHQNVRQQEVTITQLKAELKGTATRQQKQIEALSASLEKVSAQLELTKTAPRTVLNNQ